MRRKRSRKEMRTTVEMKKKIVAKKRRKRVKESKSRLRRMRSTKRMKRKRKTVMNSRVKKIKIKIKIKYRSMKTVKSDSQRHTPREKRSKDTFLKKKTKIKPTKLWKKRLHLTRNLKR